MQTSIRALLVALTLWGCGTAEVSPSPAPNGDVTDEDTPSDDVTDEDSPSDDDAGEGDAIGDVTDTDPPSDPITDEQRRVATTATAESTTNACSAIQPFYWEVGRASGATASGSIGDQYAADTVMSIASASKWLYSGYVVERRDGVPTAEDIKFLSFRSGYTNFALCLQGQTVEGCLNAGSNGDFSSETDGYFYYGGGHMQKHATLMGLGAMKNEALATEMRSRLGTDIALGYNQPQLAGGAATSAAEYTKYLRKLLDGTLRMGALLGSHAVCTNPSTCPDALNAPVPETESFHYSLGHWVEDDPVDGDGAFSSAGAFGFYPWVDAGKTTYGVVARSSHTGNAGYASMKCGRLIRQAWLSGVAQGGASP